jgi:hypothetical protein
MAVADAKASSRNAPSRGVGGGSSAFRWLQCAAPMTSAESEDEPEELVGEVDLRVQPLPRPPVGQGDRFGANREGARQHGEEVAPPSLEIAHESEEHGGAEQGGRDHHRERPPRAHLPAPPGHGGEPGGDGSDEEDRGPVSEERQDRQDAAREERSRRSPLEIQRERDEEPDAHEHPIHLELHAGLVDGADRKAHEDGRRRECGEQAVRRDEHEDVQSRRRQEGHPEVEGARRPLVEACDPRVLLEDRLHEKWMVGVVVRAAYAVAPARVRVDRDAELGSQIAIAISRAGPEQEIGVVVVVVQARIEERQTQLPPAHPQLQAEHGAEGEGDPGGSSPARGLRVPPGPVRRDRSVARSAGQVRGF